MRSIKITFILLAIGQLIFAQENPDTSYWTKTGKVALNFSQVGLTNWSGGGDASLAFNGIFNFAFKYEKDPHLWDNMLDAGYGAQRIGGNDEPFKKSDDKLVFLSKYGYKISGKWYASAMSDFRTQFYNGYSYDNDTSVLISNFMAPAYWKIGLGVTYNHNFSEEESFSLTFSPLNGRTTFVMDDELSDQGAFGVDPGKKTVFHAGLDLTMAISKKLVENVTLTSTLGLFSRYQDLAVMDVNWDLLLWFKINEFLSASISTQLLYNQDIAFSNPDGSTYGSAVQFKEVLGIGFSYSF
jgi:hypothetical protein